MFAHVNLPSLTWHLPNWQTQISSSTTVIQHPGHQSEKQSGFDPFAVRSCRISLKHLWKIVAPLSMRVLQHKHRRDPCAAAPFEPSSSLGLSRVSHEATGHPPFLLSGSTPFTGPSTEQHPLPVPLLPVPSFTPHDQKRGSGGP